jgi:uncharacterized repeat protein (TIGR04138 family)
MLCNECNQRQAKVHITEIVGDKTTTRHLCQVCGQSFISSARIGSSQMTPDDMGTDYVLTEIIARDERYTRDAYHFVLGGCQKVWEKQFAAGDFTVTHISGGQLLEAFRKHALNMFGNEAKSKLNAWGIFKCEDFGEIVFNLIGAGLLMARAEDTKEDFLGGYDFDTAFPGTAQ